MKKKLMSVLLTVAATVTLLVGCSGINVFAEDAAAETTVDVSVAQGKKIGMTVPTLASDFINYLTQAAQATVAEELGCDMQIDSCDGDVTKQIEQIENYVTMGMDLIIVFPVNGEALGTVVKNAVDAGVPVFGFAMEIPNVTSEMISAEETVMGSACGDMANEWINETFADRGDGEVNVYVLRGSTQPEIVVRSDAIVEALKTNPKNNIIEEESENQDDRNVARRMTENQFNANPDIDVIVTCNAESALGAESFIMSSDSPVADMSKFAIFTVDETDEVDAKISASLTDESALRGTISMGGIPDTIADLMKGIVPILTESEIIPRIDGSIFPIDDSNIEEYMNK
ncbi:MAG: sugar ABC transporter substrate-binding protein [Blautia sp.]|nr:sugar ABC transporter substrate-binding protein [Blautia sp.]